VNAIATDDLTVGDVPSEGATLDEILEFAHTYNAYEEQGNFHIAAEIANRRADDSLEDLRTCLFFEARRWRHFGDDPDPGAEQYIRSVVAPVRPRRVQRGSPFSSGGGSRGVWR